MFCLFYFYRIILKTMSCKRFLSFVTVEPALFLYMLAIFLETSVLQDLISTKICMNQTNFSETLCRGLENNTFYKNLTKNKIYEEERTTWITYNNAILYGLNLVVASYMGSWSDKFSRKLVMLIPPINSILACINFIIISNYLYSRMELIFISSILSGLSGGTVAFIGSCFGYLSNITIKETRNKRIAFTEAMLIIGGTVGFYIGGGMLKHTNYVDIFILELCIHCLSVIYIIFFIKELKHDDKIQSGNLCTKFFSVKHIIEMFSMIFRQREDNKRCYIVLSLIATILVYYGLTVQIALLYLFVTSEPLQWNQELYSYFSGENFAISGTALLIGLPAAYHFCKIKDTTAGIMGISSRMIGLIFLGLSYTKVMMFISPLFFIFSDYSVPALRSILSKLVNANETGKLFAFMASLQNISFLTGTVFNAIYLHTPNYFCFELVAGFQAIALCILIFLHRNLEQENINYKEMNEEIESAHTEEIS
ncbi:proton-coupled folate transporter-like [Centruroides vittatus]|uniref:proton-coupled folate transporter-like n=1 Tax=Centruroides vittatus TaxID=120091 RepID=UPI003510D0CB